MRWLFSIALILTAGCSFSADGMTCVTDEDCADGTICSPRAGCVQGERRDGGSDDEVDATMSPDVSDSLQDAELDMQTTAPDMSVTTPDMSSTSDASTHMPDMSDPDPTPPSSCIIDPFNAVCSEDPNEPNGSLAVATNVGQTGGCTFDEFIETDATFDGELCRDDEDWFRQNFVQCEERSLTIEVVAIPLVSCAHSDWSLRVNAQQCAATNVRCENLADGSKKITVTYPKVSIATSRSANIVLEAGTTVQLPYELQVRLR